MAKRAINWTEIEARYKAGERPTDIAKDYKCCTSGMIRSKAHREGWKVQKEEIRNTVVSRVADIVTEGVVESRAKAISEVELLAYSDMKDYLTIDSDTGCVRAKGFEDMPPNASKAIKKVKERRIITERPNGETIVIATFEFELHNKLGALQLLSDIEAFAKPAKKEEETKTTHKEHIVVQFKRPEQRQ